MLESVAFDFIGLSFLGLCLAVVVTPGPRSQGRRKFVPDEFRAVISENPKAAQNHDVHDRDTGIQQGS